jgi:hypothetical protein
MAYSETTDGPLTTVTLTCDASKRGRVCGNTAEITMQDRDAIERFLLALGWRLLRGHQVCGSCLSRGKVSFPRKPKVSA